MFHFQVGGSSHAAAMTSMERLMTDIRPMVEGELGPLATLNAPAPAAVRRRLAAAYLPDVFPGVFPGVFPDVFPAIPRRRGRARPRSPRGTGRSSPQKRSTVIGQWSDGRPRRGSASAVVQTTCRRDAASTRRHARGPNTKKSIG